MNIRQLSVALTFGLLLSIGCGKGPADSSAPSGAAQTSAPAAQTGTHEAAIQQVVTTFLDAVRRGDTHAANAQLTPLALKQINENNMTISPPASETARFKVGAVEVLDPRRAIVDTVWTELDVDGQSYDQYTTWALRFGNGQWRISAMSEDMGPDQEPIYIDFENPSDLSQVQPPQSGGGGAARQASQPSEDPFQQGLTR